MTSSALQFGTRIAPDIREASANSTLEARKFKTLGDLLNVWREQPPRQIAMLRSTCVMLASYLDKPTDEITIDSVNDARGGVRPFLESRKYAENSIRTYVNHVRILLNLACEFGWKPDESFPEEWRAVLVLAKGRRCDDLAKYLARIRKKPKDVTIEDLDQWTQIRCEQGLSYAYARNKKTWFWRLLRDCGCTEQTPRCFLRENHFGVPLEQFPPGLKREVHGLLKWKQLEFAVDRPKGGRHRAVTSQKLQRILCALLGFAINVRGESELSSLSQLIQKQIISGYLEWSINERKVKGYSLGCDLRLLAAAMRQHPSYASVDFSWFKPLLNSLPIEPKSELKKRKALKCLEYKVIESIPRKIHAERSAAAKKGVDHVALLAMEELLIRWLTVLPWRQRNIRECRISGTTPNLFKGKVPPFCGIDKPEWAQREEQESPEAEFWQFRFNCDETKTKIDAHAVLPRPLIGPLEEYLGEFRPHLIHGADPGTLFVNQAGKAMASDEVSCAVSTLTLRHGGRRVTPHLFRDIVAFTWLKEHPEDFLTLSKMLWHSNINTTIQIYGSRFNESSGVCAMESWLEGREAKSK
jgi:hypothetical protein